MICHTIEGGMLLTCTAGMLGLYGSSCTDVLLAKGMEAPFLLHRNGYRYVAGTGLFHPAYINPYLSSLGFRLVHQQLPPAEVGAFLRRQPCASLTLQTEPELQQTIVFCGYENRRYTFLCPKKRYSQEDDCLCLTGIALKRRLAPLTTVFTLEKIPPQKTDFIPLLMNTLENIASLSHALRTLPPMLSPAEFQQYDAQFFRPFMLDYHALLPLTEDVDFADTYRRLHHRYRQLLIRSEEMPVRLQGRLPVQAALTCLQYWYEDVLDRLYALGADDAQLEGYHDFPQW